MKSNNDAKLLTAFAIVMALALAPISGSVFAQTDDVVPADSLDVDTQVDDEKTSDVSQDVREDKIREMQEKRAEKVREIKERMMEKYDERLKTITDATDRPSIVPHDRDADLVFKGETNGWTVVGGQAWRSSIAFAGDAFHVEGNEWIVHVTDGKIKVAEREAELKMKGHVKGHRITLHGIGELESGDHVRLFLRGYYAPTSEYGQFAIAFTQAAYHNVNTGERLPIAQVGAVHVEAIGNVPIPEPLPYETLDAPLG